jgi:hypothetical protein
MLSSMLSVWPDVEVCQPRLTNAVEVRTSQPGERRRCYPLETVISGAAP